MGSVEERGPQPHYLEGWPQEGIVGRQHRERWMLRRAGRCRQRDHFLRVTRTRSPDVGRGSSSSQDM